MYLSGSEYGLGFVEEFPNGQNPGVDLGITTTAVGGILVDTSGNLVVADPGLPGVEIFPPGGHSPSTVFATSGAPTSIAFDKAQQNITVTDPVNGTIARYSYPQGVLEDAGPLMSQGQSAVPETFQEVK